ncbi:MAG: hypothetical protein V2A79_02185 [Planctomycetota bacterium]
MKAISLLVGLSAVASIALAGMPPVPATPAAVGELVYARPFTLENGYPHLWSKDQPLVTTGYLLVLKVNPDLVIPRQVAEPVLYVGDQTAQRVNFGNESGCVIALAPGELDLTQAPIWFGRPELPERVDAATVRAERALADKAGIKPFSAEQVAAALAKGGARLNVADQTVLLGGEAAKLVLEYSPTERALAEALQVPMTK